MSDGHAHPLVMLVRVSLTKEHPISGARLTLANDVGVFERVLNLMEGDFRAPAKNFAVPSVLMQDDASPDNTLRG
jgi:hypothetical protein